MTLIAAIGVAIGTMALFLVLSAFSGLKEFSVDIMSYSDPDIRVVPSKGKIMFFDENQKNTLSQINGVAYFASVLEERAYFKHRNNEVIAYLRGVDSNYIKVVPIEKNLLHGTWVTRKYPSLVLGNELSNKLELSIYNNNSAIEVFIPKKGTKYISSISNSYRKMSYAFQGIYSISQDIDSKYIYANIDAVSSIMGLKKDEISHIEVKVKQGFDVFEIKEKIKSVLGSDFDVITKKELNSTFYKMLNTENLISYFVFTLILIVAMFNVVGAIIMIIINKKEHILTLYQMGLRLDDLKKIFILHGFLLSLLGLVIGLILGIALVILQEEYGFINISYNLPYPIDLNILNVLIVVLTMVILGFLASLLASSKVSFSLMKK